MKISVDLLNDRKYSSWAAYEFAIISSKLRSIGFIKNNIEQFQELYKKILDKVIDSYLKKSPKNIFGENIDNFYILNHYSDFIYVMEKLSYIPESIEKNIDIVNEYCLQTYKNSSIETIIKQTFGYSCTIVGSSEYSFVIIGNYGEYLIVDSMSSYVYSFPYEKMIEYIYNNYNMNIQLTCFYILPLP